MGDTESTEMKDQPTGAAIKWPFWVMVILSLIALAFICWLFPAYKKVVKDYANLEISLSNTQTELNRWKKKILRSYGVLREWKAQTCCSFWRIGWNNV